MVLIQHGIRQILKLRPVPDQRIQYGVGALWPAREKWYGWACIAKRNNSTANCFIIPVLLFGLYTLRWPGRRTVELETQACLPTTVVLGVAVDIRS